MSLNYYVFQKQVGNKHLSLVRVSEEEQIRQCIRGALMMRKGELKQCPELGSELFSQYFRPMSHMLQSDVQTIVKEAISIGEPRIELTGVETTLTESCALSLEVRYTIKKTAKSDAVKVVLPL